MKRVPDFLSKSTQSNSTVYEYMISILKFYTLEGVISIDYLST